MITISYENPGTIDRVIAGKEPGGSYSMSDRLYYSYTTRTLIHSHPKSDYASLKDLQYKFQVNTVLQKQKLSIPIYEIFYVPTNTYIKY
ncbi:MAG: JAB-like toxin 1 domain-containing protein [Barnesiella sp.]|uniref:JAB-like toxin 1 domain-containing protein n=1 Tax=Barnesiella propionica TaxID=2981781 RepID=UPI00374DCEE2